MEAESSADKNSGDRENSPAGLIDELISLGFSRPALDALPSAVEATRLVTYTPGQTIFYEGEEVDTLYVIRDGRIKLLNYLENGRARIVRLHNRSSILGLNGLMDEPHAHEAVAIDDVHIYQIPMQLIMVVKDKDPDTYSHLLEHLQDYLKMADTWITDFSTGAIRTRVARLLGFLVDNDVDTGPCEVTLLTVEEMADILGVTPESVSRIMADMKRKNILREISSDSPDCFQCDIKRLRREAEK
jgi:CRP/FNR family transcriptional regulator, anaerobic regulatory protein